MHLGGRPRVILNCIASDLDVCLVHIDGGMERHDEYCITCLGCSR